MFLRNWTEPKSIVGPDDIILDFRIEYVYSEEYARFSGGDGMLPIFRILIGEKNYV